MKKYLITYFKDQLITGGPIGSYVLPARWPNYIGIEAESKEHACKLFREQHSVWFTIDAVIPVEEETT